MPDFGDALNLEWINLERCTRIRQIDPSIGLLRKLTFLNLKDCKSLINLPHFGNDLNVETLNLDGCIQLKQINPSIGLLRKLTFLNLKDCKNLVSFPNSILCLSSLKYLNLSTCSKLFNIQLLHEPRDKEHMKKLCIGETPIRSYTTSSILKRWFTSPLHLLHSRAHKDSVSCLLPSVPTFPCMCHLDLSLCKLLQIPDAIGNLHCLESLNLMGNNFATLPSFKDLSKLYYLDLQHCKQLKYLPELPSRTYLESHTYKPPMPIIEYLTLESVPWPIIETLVDRIKPGLNIFNCPKLVERERCTSMTISWMIQIVQAHHQNKRLECANWPPCVESIIPGSEIPGWFNNQNVGIGNLITIDASTPDNNCTGVVVCCVIFAAPYGRATVYEMGAPYPNVSFCGTTIQVVLDEDLVMDKSDHLWLFYYTPTQFTLSQGTPLRMKIDIKNMQDFHFEVKKYGYRWVYEQDPQLSNLTVMHSETASAWKNTSSNCILATLPS